MEKHIVDKIDHTIYSVIEEWNSAKMACSYECFSLIKEKFDNNYNEVHG